MTLLRFYEISDTGKATLLKEREHPNDSFSVANPNWPDRTIYTVKRDGEETELRTTWGESWELGGNCYVVAFKKGPSAFVRLHRNGTISMLPSVIGDILRGVQATLADDYRLEPRKLADVALLHGVTGVKNRILKVMADKLDEMLPTAKQQQHQADEEDSPASWSQPGCLN